VHGFEDVALAALDAADRILVVLTQDVPAVRNAQRCVELFQALEYPEDKTQLVINRYQKHSKITTEVIVESTGLPVAATIANDFGVVIRAINRGVMLFDEAPSSRMTHDINALAAQLAGHRSKTSRQRNFFAELFTRKAAVHGAE
jgi:pilus assembly protein CpaE